MLTHSYDNKKNTKFKVIAYDGKLNVSFAREVTDSIRGLYMGKVVLLLCSAQQWDVVTVDHPTVVGSFDYGKDEDGNIKWIDVIDGNMNK